jgi:predicted metalloprotease
MQHVPRRLVTTVLLVVVAVLATGCTRVVAGRPVAASVVSTEDADTGAVADSDGGVVDQLAATAVQDVGAFWTEEFPSTFGKPWEPLRGGYYSVDTSDESAKPPPCVEKASDVEGNAFYCPTADAIAWDRTALLPVLKDRFGDAAVVVVLAHEMGHAVQRRTGITPEVEQQRPEQYPTILTEAMADCYAGAFVRWVDEDRSEHLEIGADALDSALGALITFRDPVGTSPADAQAHGSAFDRVSAFQDGYERGTRFCSEMSVDNRVFTQRSFTSTDDQARGGNLPFDDMLNEITPDLNTYFAELVGQRGGTWRPPASTPTRQEPDCSGDQGPVAWCPDAAEIEVDVAEELPELHEELGDYATGTLLASRYGLAALSALGEPVEGEDAGRGALCLAGAYTSEVFTRTTRGFGLSPGDLDEAVQVLLNHDYAARDAAGATSLGRGFERVAVFRAGVFEGLDSCRRE